MAHAPLAEELELDDMQVPVWLHHPSVKQQLSSQSEFEEHGSPGSPDESISHPVSRPRPKANARHLDASATMDRLFCSIICPPSCRLSAAGRR